MIKRILFVGCGLCLAASSVWATGAGTTSANFLKAGQGVRPIAMGETYIAEGDGLDTLYWNPAGLEQLASPTAAFTHSFWFQDIGTEYFAFGMPLGPLGALGGGLTFMHAGSIDQTTEDSFGNYAGTNGTASAGSFAFIGTYAQKLSHLMLIQSEFFQNVLVGASLRLLNETVADKSVVGGGVDVGALWRQTEEIKPTEITTANGARLQEGAAFGLRDRGWRLGLTAQNLGATTDSLMPMNFRAGAGYVAQDLFSPNGRGTLAADVLIPIDNAVKISLGAEYAHISEDTEFAVRGGYKIGPEIAELDSTAGVTAGVGVAIQAALIRYQVDYAFVPYGELGMTHRASLTLAFLPSPNVVRAVETAPRVVAPLKTEPPAAAPVETAKTAPAAEKPRNETPAAAAAPVSTAIAAPVPTPVAVAVKTDAKPDADQLFRDALERLQNRIKVGLTPGIEFKKGESVFSDKSKAALDQVGKLLERYPKTLLVVVGYDADKALAQARGAAAAKYLTMNFRINADNIVIKTGDPAKVVKNSSVTFEAATAGQ
ncbi:MAG: PorV/PorQ family protein [Candidatus Firestonebacteria bacterium]|nr:PorV/PorQ family protein [Candidatus Firestonebacteria bacterium]